MTTTPRPGLMQWAARKWAVWLASRPLDVLRFGASSPRAIARDGAKAIAARRFDEADSVLSRGLGLYPDHPRLLEGYAFSAHDSGRYIEGARRWERLRVVAPGWAAAWYGLASNEREQGRVNQAWAVIAEALRLFPNDPSVIGEAGRVALRRGRHREALDLWGRLRRRRRPHPDWLSAYIQTLIYLHDFDEADRELTAARLKHPDHRALFSMVGILAMAREDWDGALAFWTVYRQRFPDDVTGWEQQGRAIAAKQLDRMDDAAATVTLAPVDVARVDDDGIRALLLGFESIGKDCEFGMVQRRYGAEPIGLLRWTDVTAQSLEAALDARFEGMGRPETTELIDLGGYHATGDRRWGLRMQTFVPVGQIDAAALLPKMCRRIVYLRDKLLQDLESGEKIFVYKSDLIDLDQMQAILARLAAFGPARLLCVTTAEAGQASGLRGAAGEVVAISSALQVGFLRDMGNSKGYWDIAFDDWVGICRAAKDGLKTDLDGPVALNRPATPEGKTI